MEIASLQDVLVFFALVAFLLSRQLVYCGELGGGCLSKLFLAGVKGKRNINTIDMFYIYTAKQNQSSCAKQLFFGEHS